MPPTLVRPQTFDPTTRLDMPRKPRHPSRSLQSPDSASPAVRFQQTIAFCTCCDSVLPRHAFLSRTSYAVFSRCIVLTAWFSRVSTRLLSHILKPLLNQASIKFLALNCKQESSYTLPCFPPVGVAEGLQQEER